MRHLAALAVVAAACLSAPPAGAQSAPDRIEVVYHPDAMFFTVEDGGQGRFRTSDREDYAFPVSHEDYARIRDLLAPYRARGLVCDDPNVQWTHNGYLVWRDHGVETRRPHESICYTPAAQAAGQRIGQAYRLMEGWAKARWTPPPGLPAPTRMTLVWRSWGSRLQEWTLVRGGESSFIDREAAPVAFTVSEADFDRFRALFAPYEGVRFECRRVITDGAYGSVVWSQPGHEDQSLNFDAGCVSGDAADVFQRLEQAEALLRSLRDAR